MLSGLTMRRFLQRLAAAAVFVLSAGSALAQTVIVKGAAPASTVELMLNDDRAGTATVDASGFATVAGNLFTTPQKTESDVKVFVDACAGTTRVLIVETFRQPPPVAGACNREAVPDIFIARPITTFVIDVASSSPSVLIRQGRPPAEWLAGATNVPVAQKRTVPAPSGLVVGAGIGLASFSDASTVACGDVTGCQMSSAVGMAGAHASYWLKPFLAIDAGYLAPGKATTSGSGTNYHFTSDFTTDVVTVGAKTGGQAGPVRLYAMGGADYATTLVTTLQTVDASATTTAAVGTTGYKTKGWAWYAGGGVETWMKPWVGAYAEAARYVIKGASVDAANEGAVDDAMFVISAGIRIHIGPSKE